MNIDKYSSSFNKSQISGILNCYDRIIFTGTLLNRCYAGGMEKELSFNKILCYDYQKQVALPLAEKIKEHVSALATKEGIPIEYMGLSKIRKEDFVNEKIKNRGGHKGLVCILSAVESCRHFAPYHDKEKNHTGLKMKLGKCLTYYFYFIDEIFGLCFIRVPTWIPCQLMFYFNGHNYLKNKLQQEKISFKMADNCFTEIENFEKANQLSSQLDIKLLEKKLCEYTKQFVPMIEKYLVSSYYWSIKQIELSTDIVFKDDKSLNEIYEQLIITAMHTVKVKNVATFLGINIPYKNIDGIGNCTKKTYIGTRLRHNMGPHCIKMYDKYNRVLRIETTTDKVNSFRTLRPVYSRTGISEIKIASVKKNIQSLDVLFDIMSSSNRRYMEFISNLNLHVEGRKLLKKTTSPLKEGNRNYKGLNFFNEDDDMLLRIISSGEFNITGFRNKDLQEKLGLTCGQVSRQMKRLRTHGIIKKIGKSYKYYITKNGQKVIMTGLKLKELYIIPKLDFCA